MATAQRIIDADFKYMDKMGNLMKSRTEMSIAKLLSFLNKPYEYNYKVPGQPPTTVSFKTPDGYIQVLDEESDISKYNTIKERLVDENVIAMGHPRLSTRVREMDDIILYNDTTEAGSIFLDDPSFSFDYSHILPLLKKCPILHGHTSSVMVEMVGTMKDNLLVDFAEAKRLVKNVVRDFDHKFFVNEKYLKSQTDSHYRIAFSGMQGEFDLQLPKETTYLLNGEATVETLSAEVIKRLTPNLPDNVEGVGVYIYEGYNKGSHIISKVPR